MIEAILSLVTVKVVEYIKELVANLQLSGKSVILRPVASAAMLHGPF